MEQCTRVWVEVEHKRSEGLCSWVWGEVHSLWMEGDKRVWVEHSWSWEVHKRVYLEVHTQHLAPHMRVWMEAHNQHWELHSWRMGPHRMRMELHMKKTMMVRSILN